MNGECWETSAVRAFRPESAILSPFPGISQQSGPTDRPGRKSVLNRKSGKNKLSPVPGPFCRRQQLGNKFQKIMQKFLVIKIY